MGEDGAETGVRGGGELGETDLDVTRIWMRFIRDGRDDLRQEGTLINHNRGEALVTYAPCASTASSHSVEILGIIVLVECFVLPQRSNEVHFEDVF